MNKGMNGFQLKVLGVVTMVLDHIAEFFLFLGVPMWFHWIGRIAAIFKSIRIASSEFFFLKVQKVLSTPVIEKNICFVY